MEQKNSIRKPRLYLTSVHCIANQYYNSFQFTIHVPFIVSSIFRDYLKHSWCWILPVFCGPNINWLLLVRCAETIQFQSTHWANFVKVATRSISKRQRLSALFLCFPPSTCFPQSLKPRFTRIFLSFLRVSIFFNQVIWTTSSSLFAFQVNLVKPAGFNLFQVNLAKTSPAGFNLETF